MRSLLLKGDSHQRDVWSECQVHFLISVSAGTERDALRGNGVEKQQFKAEEFSLIIIAANCTDPFLQGQVLCQARSLQYCGHIPVTRAMSIPVIQLDTMRLGGLRWLD